MYQALLPGMNSELSRLISNDNQYVNVLNTKKPAFAGFRSVYFYWLFGVKPGRAIFQTT